MRNVADTGLDILYVLLQNVASEEVAAQSFYQTFFTDILQHIFSIVTDSSHTAGRYIYCKKKIIKKKYNWDAKNIYCNCPHKEQFGFTVQ